MALASVDTDSRKAKSMLLAILLSTCSRFLGVIYNFLKHKLKSVAIVTSVI